MLRFSSARGTSGSASSGLILSIVLAAGIIAMIIYYMVGPGASSSSVAKNQAVVSGAPMSPLLGSVEITRQHVDSMNRQRSAAGEALGITRTAAMDATNDLSWRARRDCSDIATAIRAFQRDIKQWPIYSAADDDEKVDFLFGVGQLPQFSEKARESWGESKDKLHSYLVSNGPEKEAWYDYFKHIGGRFDGWQGSYLPHETADPWDRAFLVSVCGFPGGTKPDNKVWCISAGPNGIVETLTSKGRIVGDDVGVLIE